LWRRRANNIDPEINVVVLPASLKEEIMQAAHGQLLSGHTGISKTTERINQSYFCANIEEVWST
jgi:hypothetical protein